jgi:hypothetical protein
VVLGRVLVERVLRFPDLVSNHPGVVGGIESDLEADHTTVVAPGSVCQLLERGIHASPSAAPRTRSALSAGG